ncbi:MAG: glucokinase [Deltaproteobacteria bacterium]|nr:glucokinase [Deltaproteobacteria bacterium]
MKLLAGDVGGTKTCLALVEEKHIVRREVYPSAQFPDLSSIISRFLGGRAQGITRACFGVAGPVYDDVCQATNLPWRIAARVLEHDLGVERVHLVNDFHALSIGITELPSSDLATLHAAPSEPRGPWVVLGAGTGLGEAILVKGPQGYEVLSSEGGHTDFGPRNDLEIELLRFLLSRHRRVSYERIVSGPGLVALYEFMRAREPAAVSTKLEAELAASSEGAAACISNHALAGDDALCVKALDLFVSIYGAEAGNLALKVIAPGGVYVAGGIAPKILPKLLDGTFEKAFLTKGRLSPILERTPVRVVTNPDTGLLGAAAIARRMA